VTYEVVRKMGFMNDFHRECTLLATGIAMYMKKPTINTNSKNQLMLFFAIASLEQLAHARTHEDQGLAHARTHEDQGSHDVWCRSEEKQSNRNLDV
jgi:hypothetical protein